MQASPQDSAGQAVAPITVGNNGSKCKFGSLSPLLSVCHNIHLGSFTNFTGSLGSGRTEAALSLMRSFTSSGPNHYGVYMSLNPKDNNTKLVSAFPNCVAIGRH